MARSSRRQNSSVSLFPFLAVLVCAMGALIFLLVVTTQRIREQVRGEAQPIVETENVDELIFADDPEDEANDASPALDAFPPEPMAEITPQIPPELPELPPVDPNIALRTEIAELQTSMEHRRQELEKAQREIVSLKNHVDDLRGKLRILETERDQSQSETEHAQRKMLATNATQQQLATEIDSALSRLRQLEGEVATRSSPYAFVAYDGQSGTARRPILIECSRAGFRFLPEGVTIGGSDVLPFTPSFNPLLSGVRSLASYWVAKDRENASPVDRPYVLILVRPSGAENLYIARQLLSQISGMYGYELIEEDWKLDLPAVDDQARKACQLAVNDALARRPEYERRLAAIQPSNNRGFVFRRGFDKPAGFADGDEGGFGPPARRVTPPRQDPADWGPPGGEFPGSRAPGSQGTADADQESGFPEGSPSLQGMGSGPVWRERPPTSSPRFPGDTSGTNSDDKGEGDSQRNQTAREGSERRNPAQPGADGNETSDVPHGSELRERGNKEGESTGPGGGVNPEQRDPHRRIFKPRGGNASSTDNETANSGGESGAPQGDGNSGSGSASQPAGGSSQATSGGGSSNGKRSEESRFSVQNPFDGLRRSRDGIGFERDVVVSVYPDRYVVGRTTVNTTPDNETPVPVDKVVELLDREVRSWGNAPHGFYWVPTLRFRVAPGGDEHYRVVRKTLAEMDLTDVARVLPAERMKVPLTEGPENTSRQ